MCFVAIWQICAGLYWVYRINSLSTRDLRPNLEFGKIIPGGQGASGWGMPAMGCCSYLRPVGALLLLFLLTACEVTGVDPNAMAAAGGASTSGIPVGTSKPAPTTPGSATKPTP